MEHQCCDFGNILLHIHGVCVCVFLWADRKPRFLEKHLSFMLKSLLGRMGSKEGAGHTLNSYWAIEKNPSSSGCRLLG